MQSDFSCKNTGVVVMYERFKSFTLNPEKTGILTEMCCKDFLLAVFVCTVVEL